MGRDDAQDVAEDDREDLEGGDTGRTQGWLGRSGTVSAECHHDRTWAFGDEECEVVGDEIAERDRDERVRESGEGVRESAGEEPGGTGAERVEGGHQGDGAQESERGRGGTAQGEVWTVVIQEGASEKPS